ncbi:hypothetical protein [Pseudarthrobacter polychromogenes]|uniref:hypothetical protein n=1 Tax=Pseudarthrobacter polychromogenes TaxID=1676 RepID=UPI0016683BEE
MINPLQLRRTSIDEDLRGASEMVRNYITLRGERLDVTQAEVDMGAPFGGAVSTMSDVNTFFGALFRGDLVSDASVNEMKKIGSSFPDYGLGIRRDERS